MENSRLLFLPPYLSPLVFSPPPSVFLSPSFLLSLSLFLFFSFPFSNPSFPLTLYLSLSPFLSLTPYSLSPLLYLSPWLSPFSVLSLSLQSPEVCPGGI